MHIKATDSAACDRRAMTDIRSLLKSAVACASTGDWSGYRARVSQLREALEDSGAAQHPAVRRQLDILSAAAPEHDALGCIAELDALRDALDADALAAPVQTDSPAAIDLRGLQPPEPIMRIFDALKRAPREPLRVILPHEPLPLYDMLRQRGFRYSGRARAEGGFEVLIQPN
jgi:uncharacterized protein (DUF2249 family)